MASTEDLITRMRRNQLLNTEQLAKVSQAAGSFTPDQLLQRLVQSNWLTKWQAVQLLRGGGPLRLGDYQLREHLARGSEAEIFRATDARGGAYALKVWPSGYFHSAKEREQLKRAVDAAKVAQHPVLVPTRASGFDRSRDFLVSDFVDGTNFETLLTEKGRLPYELVCDCIRQAALGLDAAAQLGVTHGRLRPSKLVLLRQEPGRPPRVRVLGTGVDQAINRDVGGSTIMTGSQLPPGSDYMAPELAMNPGGAKPSSDVYSLGGILFHLVAGCLAFEGKTQLAVWKERFETTPRKLRKFVADAPAALESLVARTLATDPDERLSTFAELIAGLDEVLHAAKSATVSHSDRSRTRDDDRKPKTPTIAVESRVADAESAPGAAGTSLKEPPSRRLVRFTAEVEEYLSRCVDFGLVAASQVEELREVLPRETDSPTLFSSLIERKWLTPWQANELKQRRSNFKIGPYTLVSRITVDGKTTIYKATDAQGHFVRLKVVPSGHAVDQEGIARLDRERRVAARAAHPYLLRFVDSGRTDDCCWLALEYFSELSLQDLIDRGTPIPQAWACELIARAMRAVQALADRKIYHRDLAPSWILVGREDFVDPPEVRVWGFGRVHSHDTAVKGGTVTNPEDLVGNADYMAPEQALAPREVDGRSDLYALACILFHVLAGRPPFDGDSPFEKIDIRAKADPPRLSWLRGEINRDLEYLILKMMSREASQRQKSPAEAAKELDRFGMTGGATSASSIVSAPPNASTALPVPTSPSGELRPPQTVEDFLSLAREAGLLTGDRLTEARRAVRDLKSPQLAGNRLADEGQITRWQVKRLMEGRRDFKIGRWTLVDELGDGATTVTYLATARDEAPAAIKVLTPDSALESEHVARFHRGGRLAGALSHPNIVHLIESNQDGAQHYHAMEYARGRTLREWQKTLKTFPIPLACECVRQAALGLQHAHENGVVHRDVRPANLVFSEAANGAPSAIKILGLGLGYSRDQRLQGSSLTAQTDLIGEPDYIAPEQAQDARKADGRSDVFALGGTLFHLITGRLPFEGATPIARLTARFHGAAPALRKMLPDAPPELERIIGKMLAMSPEDRYENIGQVATELAPFCKPLPPRLATPGNEPQAAGRAPQSPGDFFELVAQADLLSDQSLSEAKDRLLRDAGSAARLAEKMVDHKLLTDWQARRLLSGHAELRVGKYRLTDLVSDDGPGRMYRAVDRLDAEVLIRLLPGDLPTARDFQQKMQRNVKLPSLLHHTHLLPIVEAGVLQDPQHGDQIYFVWDYAPGLSLEQVLVKHPRPPVGWCCDVIRQAALGLDFAHQLGVFHRYLLPRDLFLGVKDLDGSPRVQVMNLALADAGRELGNASSGGSRLIPRTVDYVAPEQIDKPDKWTPRSDVYSLGCIFFHLLTGRIPFAGAAPLERLMARFRQQLPSPSGVRDEIPETVEAVVAKMTAKDPEQRYETLGAVAEALAPLVAAASGGAGFSPIALHTVPQILSLLQRSNLLSATEFKLIEQEFTEKDDVQQLGATLIERKWLTQWQWTQIMLGSRNYLLGKYVLLDCLGRGASGTVYLARDPEGKIVALKVLADDQLDDSEGLARFLREGRVATRLDHPNIARVYAALKEGNKHFLVMEYIQGRDLKDWIAKAHPLPIPWVCECVRQVALGLAHAHAAGVVHRDVKPSNVLVVGDSFSRLPRVKILDMGIANATQREVKGQTVTRMGELLGTPDYMAPEQAQDAKHADYRADVYSLGCTLFHLLTGKTPFDGETPMAKLTARFKQDPPLANELRSNVPPELAAVVHKMLARDPDDRYGTADEVANALAPFSQSQLRKKADSPSSEFSPTFRSTESEQFFALVVRSELLNKDQVRQLRDAAVDATDPRLLAKFMLDNEWITRWQARQLLEKRADFSLGSYSLIDLIGRGATGNVYKARAKGGQIVALKVLNPDLMKKPEAVARFQREMRIAAALKHPHIVMAYDTGQLGDDTHYIAMEFVEGRDLKSWLNQLGALPIAWACECVKQAAIGLQHAHEQGIVHRDIKPGNLLVVADSIDAKPSVKVLDLGFANAARKDLKRNSLTKADQLLGTPDYMSPEQAEDPTSADIRSDIYSLGATLFRLLANRPPFLGNNPIEKLHARLREEAPLVRAFRPEVPPKLEAIIAKMLARSVDARFNEPKEVVAALEPFSMTAVETSKDASSMQFEASVGPAVAPTQTGRKVLAGLFAGGGLLGGGAAFMLNPLVGAAVGVVGLVAAALTYPRNAGGDSLVSVKRWGKVTVGLDLLARVDPVRDRVSGDWTSSKHGLLSPADDYARIKVPLNLPIEYTLRATVKRVDGLGPLVLGLVVGRSQCFITVDGWGGTLSGLGLIDGRPYDANPTTFKGHILNDGQPTELIVEVTEASVRLLADGTEILAWRGDADHLSLFPAWQVPDRDWLFIGAHGCVYEVQDLRLVPNSPMPEQADEPVQTA